MSSFWGARWNLTAANTLRFMVYDTVCDGERAAVQLMLYQLPMAQPDVAQLSMICSPRNLSLYLSVVLSSRTSSSETQGGWCRSGQTARQRELPRR